MPLPRRNAFELRGISNRGPDRHGPQERDLGADLVPLLAALRRFGSDGDAAVALLAPIGDELRATLCKEACRRPGMFSAPVLRALLASTPRPALVAAMGLHAAAVAYRQHVGP